MIFITVAVVVIMIHIIIALNIMLIFFLILKAMIFTEKMKIPRARHDPSSAGCFGKDQVYLDGILKILRYREEIDFPLLMALGKVIGE